MDTKGKLAARLLDARRALGMSQPALAALTGVGQRTISNMETGQVAYTERWRELATALSIPEEEMRRLMNEARRESGKTTRLPAALKAMAAPQHTAPFPTPGDQVPILGQAVGGDDGRLLFNGSVVGWVPRPHALLGVQDAYAVFVAGESMEPRYRPGETVWVHPHRPPHVGSDVVVQIRGADGEAPSGFIKEYRGIAGSKLVLRQHNPARDIKVDHADVVSVHTVVFAERS